MENHVNFHIFNGLSIPRPDLNSPFRTRVVEIAGCLAAVDGRYAGWAVKVGVPTGSIADPATKLDLEAELDALVSLLYDLDREEVEHVFETFHRGWNYEQHLDAVLSHFDSWKNKATM